MIYSSAAGSWTSGNSNANTVPTVANGHVYVATYQELAIFGLGSPAKLAAREALVNSVHAAAATARPGFKLGANQHAVWGKIASVTQSEMTIQTRVGAQVQVYLTAARNAGNVAAPVVGQAAVVIGSFATDGLLVASNVEHAKPEPETWPKDQ